MTDTTARPVEQAPPALALSPWRAISPAAQARRKKLLLAVAALFVLVSIPFGFPTGRDVITAWVLLLPRQVHRLGLDLLDGAQSVRHRVW